MRVRPPIGRQSVPLKPRTGYLSTLDGWRAIAILAVIVHHDSLHSTGLAYWLFANGKSGVDLFFAISGLLICTRLLEEEQSFGLISMRNFYVRRAFRILPPAFLYLGVIGILGLSGVLGLGAREWFGAVFFFRNYTSLLGRLGPDSYFTAHFWSLAVEEHFYLILPALLVLTYKRWRWQSLTLLAVIIEIHRIVVLGSRNWEYVSHHTDIRLNALLVPAIFAILLQANNVREKAARLLRIWPLLFVAVIFLISHWEGTFLQSTLVSVLMPTFVIGSVLNPEGYLARALEWAPLRYIGRISYSLYLWQMIFFTGHFYNGSPLGILQSTPLRYLGLLIVAAASYHILERPMIRLGHRLAPPATPGREDALDDLSKYEALSHKDPKPEVDSFGEVP